jgi:hypothetical protein
MILVNEDKVFAVMLDGDPEWYDVDVEDGVSSFYTDVLGFGVPGSGAVDHEVGLGFSFEYGGETVSGPVSSIRLVKTT